MVLSYFDQYPVTITCPKAGCGMVQNARLRDLIGKATVSCTSCSAPIDLTVDPYKTEICDKTRWAEDLDKQARAQKKTVSRLE